MALNSQPHVKSALWGVDQEGKVTFRISRWNYFEANKLLLYCFIAFKFEFYIEIIFQNNNLKKII